MKRIENKSSLSTFAIGRHSFLSRISELLEESGTSEQLVVAAYLLEETNFLYCNSAFKNLLGTKMDRLLEGGWNFWFSNMSPEESFLIKNQILGFLSAPFDRKRLALRYHILNAEDKSICLKHEMVLYKFNACTMALNYFFDVSEKERIEHYLNGHSLNTVIQRKKDERPITPREEEVLKLIANGYSSKQIANQLCISNHTAISHRKNLLQKFQVKNTAHLVKIATNFIHF